MVRSRILKLEKGLWLEALREYVDDLQNPTTILGYRDGDEWFNSNGISISDPGIVADASNTGKITPYLETVGLS